MSRPTREQEVEALAREIASERGVTLAVARRIARRELPRLTRVCQGWHDGMLAGVADAWDAVSDAQRPTA